VAAQKKAGPTPCSEDTVRRAVTTLVEEGKILKLPGFHLGLPPPPPPPELFSP